MQGFSCKTDRIIFAALPGALFGKYYSVGFSCKTDRIIFAEQSSRKSGELIVRQTFSGLQSFRIPAFEEKHIRPGSGGLELLLRAHWHRFHRLKCFLCNAEVTLLRDG